MICSLTDTVQSVENDQLTCFWCLTEDLLKNFISKIENDDSLKDHLSAVLEKHKSSFTQKIKESPYLMSQDSFSSFSALVFCIINYRDIEAMRTSYCSIFSSFKSMELENSIYVLFPYCNHDQMTIQSQLRYFAITLYMYFYSFTKYKKMADRLPYKPSTVNLLVHNQYNCYLNTDESATIQEYNEEQWETLKKEVQIGTVIGQNICESRDLVNEQADVCTPEYIMNLCLEKQKKYNFQLEILDFEALKEKHLELIVSVGQGAIHPPYLCILFFKNDPSKDSYSAIVGKGITYDSGGMALKKTDSMVEQHTDMTGSSVALFTFLSLCELHIPINFLVALPLAENAISGNAYKNGAILTSLKGYTIKIKSTDAEGRLVLADAMTYIQQHYSIDTMFDVATLTGAIYNYLDSYYTGIFSTLPLDDSMVSTLTKCGTDVSELLWRMPIHPSYVEDLAKGSPIADLVNSMPGSRGSASRAAAFLSYFVEKDTKWVHFDIAGSSGNKSFDWSSKLTEPVCIQLFTHYFIDYVSSH